MIKSPPKAHFFSRKADTAVKYRRFDDALDCHKKAAEYLDEAGKQTSIIKAVESLKLQKEFHEKQQDLIKIKKSQYEKYISTIENQKQKATVITEKDVNLANNKTVDSCQLQLAIYKTMEETDSLLEVLNRRGSDTDSLKSMDSEVEESKPSSETSSLGIKKPKDDTVVIEELRTLNHQLHIMVFQLVTKLDESIQEADSLRDKVIFFEKEKNESQPRLITDHSKKNKIFITNSDNSSSNTYAYSSCNDLSPDAIEAQEELPPLAPLELPIFDLNAFANNKPLDDSEYQ